MELGEMDLKSALLLKGIPAAIVPKRFSVTGKITVSSYASSKIHIQILHTLCIYKTWALRLSYVL